MMNIRVASWNICLGVSNKLNYIKNLLCTENIDVLFIQESEIQNQTNRSFYDIDNYKLEISETINSGKARMCCYIKKDITYIVNKTNNSIELISLKIGNLTLNGYYRPFKTPHHSNKLEYIQESVEALVMIPKNKYEILIGDFNLDTNHKNNPNYRNKNCG